MYVVTVKFEINAENFDEFQSAMQKQASDSLALEEHCLYFDICVSEKPRSLIFLYEIYTNKEAFNDHLDSDHFQNFSKVTANWVKSKHVECYLKI